MLTRKPLYISVAIILYWYKIAFDQIIKSGQKTLLPKSSKARQKPALFLLQIKKPHITYHPQPPHNHTTYSHPPPIQLPESAQK